MIQKEKKLPVSIRKLEALLRRLPAEHPKYRLIENDLSRRMAGYRGEQSLNYHLSFLPEQDYLIFHDLRLPGRNHFFQIDILILSSSFLLILEVKHITGSLVFDQNFEQFTRSLNGTEEVFANPILQAERQADQLLEWMKRYNYTQLPVEFLVVMSHSQAILKDKDGNRGTKRVVRSEGFQKKIQQIEQFYKEPRLSSKEVRKLSSLFLKHHAPLEVNVLTQFQLKEEEILTGVCCPSCQRLAMERRQGTWKCPHCTFSARDAHLSALQDYACIFQNEITNSQLRSFLHIHAPLQAQRLLRSMNLPRTGNTKGRTYQLPLETL